MHTSQLIQALDSYLKQITINCLYPSVIVQSVNVQSCNFSQPHRATEWQTHRTVQTDCTTLSPDDTQLLVSLTVTD